MLFLHLFAATLLSSTCSFHLFVSFRFSNMQNTFFSSLYWGTFFSPAPPSSPVSVFIFRLTVPSQFFYSNYVFLCTFLLLILVSCSSMLLEISFLSFFIVFDCIWFSLCLILVIPYISFHPVSV